MAHYTCGGRGHRVLSRLAEGPATTFQLKLASAPDGSSRKRNRAWMLIDQLRSDGCLLRGAGEFVITQAGLDALACLNGGAPFITGTPHARYFGEAA